MDPPPLDPSTGAKGSRLSRQAGRVNFAAQPRAGAEAAPMRGDAMTAHRDLKRIIRERQSKTGESYTSARVHVMRERATLLGLVAPEPIAEETLRVDAPVLKINRQSARVRLSRESGELTFRSRYVCDIVPR